MDQPYIVQQQIWQLQQQLSLLYQQQTEQQYLLSPEGMAQQQYQMQRRAFQTVLSGPRKQQRSSQEQDQRQSPSLSSLTEDIKLVSQRQEKEAQYQRGYNGLRKKSLDDMQQGLKQELQQIMLLVRQVIGQQKELSGEFREIQNRFPPHLP